MVFNRTTFDCDSCFVVISIERYWLSKKRDIMKYASLAFVKPDWRFAYYILCDPVARVNIYGVLSVAIGRTIVMTRCVVCLHVCAIIITCLFIQARWSDEQCAIIAETKSSEEGY